MFIGHYGIAFALKHFAPRLSLGWLFLAVSAADILFYAFYLAGFESAIVEPGVTAMVPVRFVFFPFSHGLAGTLALSLLVLLVARLRNGNTPIWILPTAVFSHWLLDIAVHVGSKAQGRTTRKPAPNSRWLGKL